jgi:hypothetical protein
MLFGLGTLAKSTVRLFFIPFVFAPIFYLSKFKFDKKFLQKTLNYYFLVAVTAIIALIFYNIQRLSPFMHFIEQKNTTFVKAPLEFLSSPLDPLIHNLTTVPYYFLSESGYLLVILGIYGLFLLFKKRPALSFQLFLFFLIPFLAIASLARVVFPRYLIFLTIPFLLGMVYLWTTLKRKLIFSVTYFLSIGLFSFYVIFSPQLLPWPEIDRGQYFEGASSGHGTLQIVKYLQKETVNNQQIYVFTQGTFGLLPYALDIYFPHNQPQVKFEARWPLKQEDVNYAQVLAKKYPVYFVFHEKTEIDPNWNLKLIKKYPRYNAQSFVYFYRYVPKNQ